MTILVSQYAHIMYDICVRNSYVAAKLYTTVIRKLMNSNKLIQKDSPLFLIVII